VYGVDISPVQPLYVAENCCFYLENALEGLSFQDQNFDLVQSRCLGAGIPDKKWPSYVQELWRITKPGGWVQVIEIDPLRYCDDGGMPAQSALADFEAIAERVMKSKYGITIHGAGSKLAQHVQNAGFINVNQVNIKSPLGMWTQRTTFTIEYL
jgi:ubiquinone/menaquinone biosynthesis C-methylase UbiE